MRFPPLPIALAAWVFAAWPSATLADLILDRSPGVPGASVTRNDFANLDAVQRFADNFALGSNTRLDGMDIYGATTTGSVGDLATIRIWSDAAGQPGAVLSQFDEPVSIIDGVGATSGNHRLHVDFASPILLNAATTYWIGMTGKSTDLTQAALSGLFGGDGKMFEFTLGNPQGLLPIGDMAFRLEGVALGALPEPSSLISGSAGILLSLAVVRSRRRPPTSPPPQAER